MTKNLSKLEYIEQRRGELISKATSILAYFRHPVEKIKWDPMIPSDYLKYSGATKMHGHFHMCREELCKKKFRIVHFSVSANGISTTRWGLLVGKVSMQPHLLWIDNPELLTISLEEKKLFLCGTRTALI